MKHVKIAGVDADELARRLAALSHPARLEILQQLSQAECCCKDVVGGLNLAQSTVSQHLKILVAAGLIRLTPSKQRSVYRIDREIMMQTAALMTKMVDACCGAEACAVPAEPQSRNGF